MKTAVLSLWFTVINSFDIQRDFLDSIIGDGYATASICDSASYLFSVKSLTFTPTQPKAGDTISLNIQGTASMIL